MTAIDAMTDDALRRAIAEALGYKPVYARDYYDGITEYRIALYEYGNGLVNVLPDWPNDEAAALTLMEIGVNLARVDPAEWPGAWEAQELPFAI